MGREVELNLLSGPIPPIIKLLSPVQEKDTPVNGFLTTEHGILLLVARPILTTAKKGTSLGVVFMGRFFTQTASCNNLRKVSRSKSRFCSSMNPG